MISPLWAREWKSKTRWFQLIIYIMDVTSIHLYVSIFLTPVKVYVISTGKPGIDNMINVGHIHNVDN